MKKIVTSFFIILVLTALSQADNGKKVFETYCWGCHHQTAEAFGPSFEEISSKRSSDEIRAMITDPVSVSKIFGYKRNAMPAFPDMKPEEIKAITAYILSFRSDNTVDKNKLKKHNKTIIKEPYPNIALTKENK
jgi:mono/diheme cytochrome c family protein